MDLKSVKIGVIIPDRGDRPKFLANCLRMMNAQTLQPSDVLIVDYEALNNDCDITQRYRKGYDYFRGKGFDIIALIENDDYYAPNYLEVMISKWLELGKPELLGHDYTIYYHIKLFGYFTMNHDIRSSAMNTLIKPDLNFEWCHDNEPYTDLHLWKTLKGKIFHPEKPICLGIKHGIGLCGGRSHIDRLHRYSGGRGVIDENKEFLRSSMDKESFEFYSNYFSENNVETGEEILQRRDNEK